MTGNLTFDGLN